MFGIIYGLENLLNHKIYIGQTHRTLEARFRQHKCANTLIGRAIRKYGKENFVKVILEECENQEQLDASNIHLKLLQKFLPLVKVKKFPLNNVKNFQPRIKVNLLGTKAKKLF